MAKERLRKSELAGQNGKIIDVEKRLKANQKEQRKSDPAGQNDKIIIVHTEFAANQERTEIQLGEGKGFDNNTLLEMLGFERDKAGDLKLPTENHEFDRTKNGKVIKNKTPDGSRKIVEIYGDTIETSDGKIISIEEKVKERKEKETADLDRGA